jgi:hypothetical protein
MHLTALAAAFLLVCAAVAHGGAVTIEATPGGGFELRRDGEAFEIRGAGGTADVALLAELGGNATRTWGIGPDTPAVLDAAEEAGVAVTLGFWLQHVGPEVNYDDPDLRQRQRDEFRGHVEQFKDHPALLMWCIGNEAEVMGNSTPTYWKHVNDLAAIAKEVDGAHPVVTITADMGDGAAEKIPEFAPLIDVWGLNSYGGAESLPRRLSEAGWDKPYFVGEFGPLGQWERPKYEDVPLEQTSTEKAAIYGRVLAALESDPNCLGSYAFLWGQKQEATATWFGLFTPSGRTVAAVDVLHRHWTGTWPDNLAPQLLDLGDRGVTINAGETHTVTAFAADPEGGPLTYEWALRPVTGGGNNFGAFEPDAEDKSRYLLTEGNAATTAAELPPGKYRVFVEAVDAVGKAATGNVVVVVEGTEGRRD